MSVAHPIRLQCKQVVEHVTELLGGDLPAEDLIRLEQHLLVCPPCTLHVQQVRDTIALARETRVTTAPADALAAFRQWRKVK
ncbi:MAG: zf-HC2 domain-containing protein [Kofleriaceae bacterium]